MSGTPVTILEGPFMGLKGTVLREKGDQLVVRVDVFGRAAEVTLERRVLGLPGATLDVLEAEVVEAVARGGFRQRLFAFWQREARRSPPRDPPEIAADHDAFSAEVLAAEESAQADALKRFRAAYASLDAAARDARWTTERSGWTAWRDAATAESDAHEGPLLAGLEGDARDAARRRLNDDALQVRARVLAWNRSHTLSAVPPPEPRNLELEAQIFRDPDADAPFLVYGDWLSGQGDPRGELVALQAAGPDRTRAEAALRAKLLPRLLGPLAQFDDRVKAQWRLGFLASLAVEATRADEAAGIRVSGVLDAALRRQSSRFLRALTIGCPSAHEESEADAVFRVLAAHPPRLLRRLAFVTNAEEEMLSWTSAGRLDALAALFPALEELQVRAGSFALNRPSFPNLRVLSLQSCQLAVPTLGALIAAEWPALEDLTVWVGSASFGSHVGLEHVVPLLDSPRLPRLKRLGLDNNELTDALCAAVLCSPLLPRLDALSLTMGTMTEAGARTLAAGADRLKHLRTIDVDDNYLPDDALADLQRLLPQVTSQSQRRPEEQDGQVHRYASVAE